MRLKILGGKLSKLFKTKNHFLQTFDPQSIINDHQRYYFPIKFNKTAIFLASDWSSGQIDGAMTNNDQSEGRKMMTSLIRCRNCSIVVTDIIVWIIECLRSKVTC